MRRILGEKTSSYPTKGEIAKARWGVELNLSEVLENLPMTINQEDLKVRAVLDNGRITLMVYVDEIIDGSFAGGEYEIPQPEEE